MKKLALLIASLALAIVAAGCGGKGSPADYPADFKVTASDASVIVTWTAEPGVDYWIFYGPGEAITTANWALSGGSVITKATSPRVITGLTNGKTYSFTINARKDGGPGGTGAPTQVAVPQLAGANWAAGTPLGTGNLNGIAIGLGSAGRANIAVGANGTIFTSINDAAATTPANPAAPANLNAVLYGGIGFVALGDNGTILFGTDGTTWATQASGTTARLNGGASLSFGGFIAVGDAGTVVTSTSGTSWTLASAGTAANLHAVTLGSNAFVAVGANGTIVTSTDGVTWTPAVSGTTADLRGVAYTTTSTLVGDTILVQNVYVAVGANGTVLRSSDAATWTPLAPLSPHDLTAVVYGGQFVAVGKSGVIFTSTDGTSWTARTSGTTADLLAVTRTLTGYTAVGAAGTNVSTF